MPDNLTLAFNQDRLSDALDAADIGIWDYNPVSGEILWSRKIYEFFGLSSNKAVDFDTFISGIHPEDRDLVREALNNRVEPLNGKDILIEFRVIGIEDKRLRWLRATGKAYFDEKGQVTRLVGTKVDVTKEKNMQVLNREREHLLTDITHAAPVVLWMADRKGDCTFISQVWTEWTGLSFEESLGSGWLNAIVEEDRTNLLKEMESSVQTRTHYFMDFRILNKEGEIRWCLSAGKPHFSNDGSFHGMIGSCLDITERKQAEEALSYKTALLWAQNEATDDGILIVDAKGKILAYNRRYNEIWHIPQDILDAGNDFAALEYAMNLLQNPDDFMNRVRELYEHPFITVEDLLYFRNGKIIQRFGKPITGAHQISYGWVWYFRDITQIKEEEEALKFKTALLEAEQISSPDGILITDGKGDMIMANSKYAELWNIPEEVLNLKNGSLRFNYAMDQLINPEEVKEKLKDVYNEVYRNIEEEVYFKNGRIVELKARPIIGNANKHYGWAWYFRDITEQKKAEQALHQKNAEMQKLIQEFRFVTDFMPQMVWASEPNGHHDFFNKQWYEYSGLTEEQLTGEGWHHLVHPDDINRAIIRWNYSLQSSEPYEMEYRFRRKDGVYRWFLGRALPFRDDKGQIIKWFGTCTDVHDNKMLTDLLEQRVIERTQELQAANTNLERSNRELEQFAYIASHDLQEPLRKIRTFIDMMNIEMKKGSIDRARQLIDKINLSSARMNDLIKDLLNFSRLNLSEGDTFEKTDLNTVLQFIMEDLELAITQSHAQIRSEPLPVIHAIPLQMSQLFYNLLNNSIKFSKKNVPPKIEIRSKLLSEEEKSKFPELDARRNFYDLTFIDNGIGFSQEYADQIFTIFQRLHSRSAYEGTGIGLALCKKIALNHQGDIYAVSEEGKGAEFHVILPE